MNKICKLKPGMGVKTFSSHENEVVYFYLKSCGIDLNGNNGTGAFSSYGLDNNGVMFYGNTFDNMLTFQEFKKLIKEEETIEIY